MNSSRERIYSALFALVSNAAPFVITSRRMQIIDQMPQSQLPALFQQQIRETTQQVLGIPPKYILRADLAVYAINPDTTQPATPQLNDLIDAVEAALKPNVVTGTQTLGGLVSHCYISGETDIFEGNLGNRAAAVIPIEIVTT